jgi:hypothetical protein
MACSKCSKDDPGVSGRWRLTPRAQQLGMLGVVVCSECGAVRPMLRAADPGMRVLARLARVGLGAGTPPLLAGDKGGS